MIASAASIGGTLVGHNAQAKQFEAQANAINREGELQMNDLARQQEQQRSASAQEMNEAAKQARADAALFETATGEFGGGSTQNRGLATLGISQGERLATIAANGRAAQGETAFRSIQVREQARSRVTSLSRPSGVGTLLTIAGQATAAATQQNSLKASKKP